MAQQVNEEQKTDLRSTITQKFEAAQLDRQKGNDHFKAGQMTEALRAYYTVLLSLKGLDQSILSAFPQPNKPLDADPSAPTVDDESMTARVKTTIGLVYTNMAACHIKKENWRRALDCAKEALKIDENNKKAVFREAQARIGLGEIQAGKTILKEMNKKQPDAAITSLLRQLDLDEKQRAKKSANEFKGFLSSGKPAASQATAKGSTGSNGTPAPPTPAQSAAIVELDDNGNPVAA